MLAVDDGDRVKKMDEKGLNEILLWCFPICSIFQRIESILFTKRMLVFVLFFST